MSLVLALVAGCGAASAGRPQAVPSPTVSADPVSLVGMWRVQVAGEQVGVLRLGGEAAFFDGCGAYEGTWLAAPDGGFLAQPQRAAECSAADAVPAWFEQARGFRPAGADRELLDETGALLAVLRPGGTPVVPAHLSGAYYRSVPTPFPFQLAWSHEPAPLPPGAQAVSEEQLIGTRWQLSGHPGVVLSFLPHGVWKGSNGCEPLGGRYSVGSRGELLGTSSAVLGISCGAPQPATWFVEGGRLGKVGDRLVFCARDGRAHAPFVPASPARG